MFAKLKYNVQVNLASNNASTKLQRPALTNIDKEPIDKEVGGRRVLLLQDVLRGQGAG